MKKRYLILIVVLILSMWAASWYFIPQWYNKQPLEAGTFGDMFGAVNALFSGLAFAGLIYTIAVQRQELQTQSKSIDMQTDEMKIQVSAIEMQTEELSLQREAIQMQTEELGLQRKAIEMQTEEIKMQREETARSADQLEGQKHLLNLQMAMSVVSDLIKAKNKTAEEIKHYLNGHWYEGYKAISMLLTNHQFNSGQLNEGSGRFTENTPSLQTYLNTFFFILNFIQEYDIKNDQKDMLCNMLNINTSDNELRLIFIAVEQNQPRLMMLKISGFHQRYNQLIEKPISPFQ